MKGGLLSFILAGMVLIGCEKNEEMQYSGGLVEIAGETFAPKERPNALWALNGNTYAVAVPFSGKEQDSVAFYLILGYHTGYQKRSIAGKNVEGEQISNGTYSSIPMGERGEVEEKFRTYHKLDSNSVFLFVDSPTED